MEEMKKFHESEYDTEPETIAQAPGVINLLGEHTDFFDGYVIQAAINNSVKIAISRRIDNSLRFFAADVGERKKTTIANLKYKREDRWANYIKGVLYEFIQLGYNFKGLDITISGDIPQGIGLGSSAAVGVATALALRELFDFEMTGIQVVQTAYLSESAFIGNSERLTDQFCSSYAEENSAVFLDVRTLEYANIPLSLNEYKLVITNSNVPVINSEEEIKDRRGECQKCLTVLNSKAQGSNLRDFRQSDLEQSMGKLTEASRRLCLHVIDENQRVLDGKKQLEHKDYLSFGRLLNRSHESLRDNFEVSCPELDWLVKRAAEIDGCAGSRMAGPGFCGCTVSLMREDAFSRYDERLEEYDRIFGFQAEYSICEPAGKARVIYSNIKHSSTI
ncbi:MAG: galactokinase [Spirochaetales bacterium]|nr:galactokinase [Spirochaetales bacterium]